MSTKSQPNHNIPIGQLAIQRAVDANLPLPATRSYGGATKRRTTAAEDFTEEFYPPRYSTDGTIIANLKFALKYESLDLRIIYAGLVAIGERDLTTWIQSEPTGAYSRKAWFLYELFSGRSLDIADAMSGNYVDALDKDRHMVANAVNSPRHRVRNNLLGTADFCPTVRKSRKIADMNSANLSAEANAVQLSYTPQMLERAANYLLKKETRSSFAIEGEAPNIGKEERFLHALHLIAEFDYKQMDEIIHLQGMIVDQRYAAKGWRTIQNYVGQTIANFDQKVHYICPRPEDVDSLMQGWMETTTRLIESDIDAVVAAAVCAYGFVFIHPFEDGNGRIHRYLIHYILAKLGFTNPGIVFPVSSAILRQMKLYDNSLEAFSKRIMPAIDWHFEPDHSIVVGNETRDLYRFFDATPQVEYLYERVAETIRIDFKRELDYIEAYDKAITKIRATIDMPDNRATLLAGLIVQNGGHLSKSKRSHFSELSDAELQSIESVLDEVANESLTH